MRFVKALGALAVLLCVTVGLPIWLTLTFGNPYPAEGISLASPLTDNGLQFVLVMTAWVLWALFTWTVVIELVDALRSRQSSHVRSYGAPGFMRSMVRPLINAILALGFAIPMGLGASTASAETPAPATSTISTTYVQTETAEPTSSPATADNAADQETAETAEAEQAPATVTVHRGDTLWNLAIKHLGEGDRFVDIVELNEGKTMNDGTMFRTARSIQPGWEISMPADSDGLAAPTHSTDEQYTVEAGDSLSQIAQDELGDAERYPEIVEASQDVAQPGGRHLTNPDHIEPGWKLNLATPTAADPAPAPVEAAPAAPENSPAPEPSVEIPPAPEQLAEQGGEAVEQAPTPAVQEQAASTEEATDAVDDDGNTVSEALMSRNGIGVFLAAGLIALLAARRRRQQRNRPIGQRIPKPSPAAAQVEFELRSVADLQMPHLLHTILRALGTPYAAQGEPMPAVQAARVSNDQVELYLAEAAQLPAPWVQLEDSDTVWTSPLQVPAEVDTDEVPDPYPMLVTIGHDDENSIVLANLEAVGPIGVSGSSIDEQQMLAAAAAELAMAPWSSDVVVTLVEGWPELAQVLDTDRCRYVPSLDELVPTGGLEVVVLTEEPDAATQRSLKDAGQIVLHPGVTTGRWGVNIDDDTHATIYPLGLSVQPQMLTTRDYDLIAEVLNTANLLPPTGPTSVETARHEAAAPPAAPETVAEPTAAQTAYEQAPSDSATATALLERTTDPIVDAPAEATSEPASAEELLNTGHPVVRIMTPNVALLNANGQKPSHWSTCLRIAVFVALHPQGSRPQLVERVWAGEQVSAKGTVNPRLSQLRAWIGDNPDTQERYMAKLHIDEAVTTDWQIFNDIVGPDVTRAATNDLERALTLIDGRPFEGEDPKLYGFADHVAQDMTSAVVDAAYEVARRRFMESRWRSVEHYAALAVMFEPGLEYLWRLWIHSAHAAKDPAGVAEAISRMNARIVDLGDDLEDETIELIEALNRHDYDSVEQLRSAL